MIGGRKRSRCESAEVPDGTVLRLEPSLPQQSIVPLILIAQLWKGPADKSMNAPAGLPERCLWLSPPQQLIVRLVLLSAQVCPCPAEMAVKGPLVSSGGLLT